MLILSVAVIGEIRVLRRTATVFLENRVIHMRKVILWIHFH